MYKYSWMGWQRKEDRDIKKWYGSPNIHKHTQMNLQATNSEWARSEIQKSLFFFFVILFTYSVAMTIIIIIIYKALMQMENFMVSLFPCCFN